MDIKLQYFYYIIFSTISLFLVNGTKNRTEGVLQAILKRAIIHKTRLRMAYDHILSNEITGQTHQ